MSFRLQQGEESSRPDAVIQLVGEKVYIESKVKAQLDLGQIKRHLCALGSQDKLIVITNNKADKTALTAIKDVRIKHITWHDIHKVFIDITRKIKNDKKYKAKINIIEQFTDYLEVIVMTEFTGFKNEDFDFWLDFNLHYASLLKNKITFFAEAVLNNLPSDIKNTYSHLKIGKISRSVKDERHAWVAIKKPVNQQDIFNQCNFTVEMSKDALCVNAVIRNGRCTDRRKPIGVFYNKLEDEKGFLQVIRKLRKNTEIAIHKRVPKTGNRIKRGNEIWLSFFSMKAEDITTREDVRYLREILKKADFPGIHIRHSVSRGEEILSNPEKLQKEIGKVICEAWPILHCLNTEATRSGSGRLLK